MREWVERTLEGRFGLTINRDKTSVRQVRRIRPTAPLR
jgi:hypothetical protein